MENASKALIMAASVLIGVVILSLTVYLYTTFSSSIQENNKQIENDQLQQFNNKFLAYEERSGTLTIYDVVTIVNMANDNNKSYDLSKQEDGNFYIIVTLNNRSIENESDEELNKLLNNTNTYKCSVEINEHTGRVKEIDFE